MKTTTTSPLALATAPSGPSLVEEASGTLAESFVSVAFAPSVLIRAFGGLVF